MKLYMVRYEDSMYPEDNRIVGQYWDYEVAEKAIADECKALFNPQYPHKHTSNALYYDIVDLEIELPAELEEAIRNLYKISKLVTIRQAVGDDDVCSAIGLSPWCVNEGRASGEEKIDLDKIKRILDNHIDM